jgi:hypothetical protein
MHQVSAVSSCIPPSKMILPHPNLISHLPFQYSHSLSLIQSLTCPLAYSLIFPDIICFTQFMSYGEPRNTAFHSRAHTHTHTHTNNQSITHLPTIVVHRTLLPNKQTGRLNKPKLFQHSISIVTDQHPLYPSPPPPTEVPNTHPCQSDPIEVYQCLVLVLEIGGKTAELLCHRGASIDAIG